MPACDKSVIEILSFIGTIAVPFVAAIAIGVAIWQIKSNANVQRRNMAYNLYQQYLMLAIKHPEIAYGNENIIRLNKENFDIYRWFVASMLLCFEEILIACPNEPDWIATIDTQLRHHSWHLAQSSSIRAGHWKDPLMRLIHRQVDRFLNGELGVRDLPKAPRTITFRLAD